MSENERKTITHGKGKFNIKVDPNADITVGDGQKIEQHFTTLPQKTEKDEVSDENEVKNEGTVIEDAEGVEIKEEGKYTIKRGRGIVIGEGNIVKKK